MATTADIYSHLNFSSKVGVAGTLANVLGGQVADIKAQDSDLVAESLGKLFHSSEHMPVESVIDFDDESENCEPEDAFVLFAESNELGALQMPAENVADIEDECENYEPEVVFDTVTKSDESDDIDNTADTNTATQFLRMKEEMKRLGFINYNDYLDYLDYLESRSMRKKDSEMEM